MKPLLRVLVALLLTARVCAAATPTPINHIASGRDQNVASSLKVTLRNPATAGAAILLGIERDVTGTPGTTITVTDDIGTNTWTQNGGGSACTSACAAAVSNNSQGLWLFYAFNVAANTQLITVTFSSADGSVVSLHCSEFYNVDTVSPFRAFGTFTGTGNPLIPSFTPTTGDLVYEFGTDVSTVAPNLTSITAGSGFTQISADLRAGTFAEYSVTATNATFSHVPTATDTWNAVAVALKPGSTSAPGAGIRVLKSEFHQFDVTATVRQTPCTGNLLIANFTSPDVSITITDSNSNTWTQADIATAANGLKNQTLYAANATCSDTMTLTATYSGTSGGLNGLTFYDVTGAATSPFDNATHSTGNLTTAGDVTSGSITPTTINGLLLNGLAVFWHTLTSCSVSSGTCTMTSVLNPLNNNDPSDGCTNLTGTASSDLWQDDGHAHVYNTSLSAVTFTYPNTSSATCTTNKGVGNWASVSAAFKTAATGAPTRTLLGVGGVAGR